jgi:hypothetical protein
MNNLIVNQKWISDKVGLNDVNQLSYYYLILRALLEF